MEIGKKTGEKFSIFRKNLSEKNLLSLKSFINENFFSNSFPIEEKYKDLLKDINIILKEGITNKAFNIIKKVSKIMNSPFMDLYKRGIYEFKDLINIIKKMPSYQKASIVGFMVAPIPGTELVSLILFGTWKIYRNNFTKEAKKCNKLGEVQYKQKDKCIRLIKKQLILKRIIQIQKLKEYCKKTKNPNKCNNKLNLKIIELKKKLNKII